MSSTSLPFPLPSIRKYWAIFKIQVTNRMAYPGDLVLQSLSIILYMFVLSKLWGATFQAAGEKSISGLTLNDTVWYLMMTETILLSKPRLGNLISTVVKDGSIAYLLNKPYNFILYQASVGLGDSLINLVFNILAGGILVWILVGPPPNPSGYPLVLLCIGLGWLLDFCFQSLIGLAAFVAEDTAAFEWIYQKVLFILGGMLIPLDFFPGWLRAISQATPFAYTIYGPARLFVDPSLGRFAGLVLGQLAWLVVAGLLVALAYRKGIQRLSINGG